MRTFKDWANDKYNDTLDTPASEPTDAPQGEETTDENRARTGWSANYPPAYFSGQYPHKYVNPKKATADLDAEQMKKK